MKHFIEFEKTRVVRLFLAGERSLDAWRSLALVPIGGDAFTQPGNGTLRGDQGTQGEDAHGLIMVVGMAQSVATGLELNSPRSLDQHSIEFLDNPIVIVFDPTSETQPTHMSPRLLAETNEVHFDDDLARHEVRGVEGVSRMPRRAHCISRCPPAFSLAHDDESRQLAHWSRQLFERLRVTLGTTNPLGLAFTVFVFALIRVGFALIRRTI
jgi:hypothetical protein